MEKRKHDGKQGGTFSLLPFAHFGPASCLPALGTNERLVFGVRL